MIDLIAFDGDDTLWHNEPLFKEVQGRFQELMACCAPGDVVAERLYATEVRNLEIFGYGVKGFTLSMIETAIELSQATVAAEAVHQIIGWGQEMLKAPVEVLPGVRDVLAALEGRYRLMLVTKGDLVNQRMKVARSGLAEYFDAIEIVAEKDEATYRDILHRAGVAPERFAMVGNSLRSDINPVLALGGVGVYVPYAVTWQHEDDSLHEGNGDRLVVIDSLRALEARLEVFIDDRDRRRA